MRKFIYSLLALLVFWFTLDITGFSLGQFNLVESPGLQSVDAAWWAIFVVCSAIFLWKEHIGKYILSMFLAAWAVLQYLSHWHYTLFGASERKLIGYNRVFENTYHIIPPSNSVLIPDLYHIVLHVLIVTLFVLMVVKIFQDHLKRHTLIKSNS